MDPGVGGGEEAGGPKRGATGKAAAGGHDDEGGEVVGFRAESIERPGAEAGATGLGEAGVEKELGRSVVELVGGAGLDDAELVGDGSKWSEWRAEGGLGFAVLFEFELRAEDGCVGLNEGIPLVADDGFWEWGTFEF